MEREGLSDTVSVIGGGRIVDGIVVTADVKAALVKHLKDIYRLRVCAFGESPQDLRMLGEADEAIVVVGEEYARSKSMEAALKNAIDNEGLQARQAVLPSNVPPLLDTLKLPLVELTEHEFINSVFRRNCATIRVHDATERPAARLLMTPMRNAQLAGPSLRKAHSRAGWYLATEFLGHVIGTGEYPIPHVRGHHTSGYSILHEDQTIIVALMRGGEPMALGVNDALPLATFLHADFPEDLKTSHLNGRKTVVLVDSVVNSGKTVVQFVQRVRNLDTTICIIVVAGVVQDEPPGGISQALSPDATVNIVALRLSNNKFTGQGTTDTGNRLFNTTYLP